MYKRVLKFCFIYWRSVCVNLVSTAVTITMNALCLHCAAVATHRVHRRYPELERATRDQILLHPGSDQWQVGSSGTPTSGPAVEK